MKSIKKHQGLLVGWVLFLVVVIMLTTQLAGKKQNLGKAAYFAGTDILLMPTEATKKIGEDFVVEMLVETKAVGGGELAKVDFVETKLCYGPELTISGSDLKDKVGIGPSFSEFLDLEVTKEKGQSCLKMVIVADKPDEKLGKGMVNVARVKFNAIKDGSGKIIVDLSGTKISGSNPDRESRDMAMQLGAVGEVNYIVGTGVAKKECQFWNIFCWIGRMFGN